MAIYPDKKNGKPTGRYRVELQVDGKRYRKRFDSLKEAQAAEALWKVDPSLADVSAAKRHDTRGKPVTLIDLMRKAHGSLWRDAATANQSWARCEDIINALQVKTIADLKTYHLDDVVEAWSEDKANGTINRHLSALRRLLKWGQDRGYVTDIPAFPNLPEDNGRMRWLSHEEQEMITSLIRSYGRDDVADIIDVAIITGMRRGEILGLTERDIEPTWVRLWKTKTKTPRSVPIDQGTHDKLKRLVQAMPSENDIRYHWDKAKAEMGLAEDAGFVFHACRHTCATRLVQSNVNLRIIQKFLGHKRIETTIRYAQVADEDLRTALGFMTNVENGGGFGGGIKGLKLVQSS